MLKTIKIVSLKSYSDNLQKMAYCQGKDFTKYI